MTEAKHGYVEAFTGRRLLDYGPFPNEATFIWTVVACSIVGALILMIIVGVILWVKCFRRPNSAVKPAPGKDVDTAVEQIVVEPSQKQLEPDVSGSKEQFESSEIPAGATQVEEFGASKTYVHPAASAPNLPARPASSTGVSELPTAAKVQRARTAPLPEISLVPGISLAAVVPDYMEGVVSNPRPPTGPPYERLLLISSRVHDLNRVLAATKASVAVVAYDWRNSSLQYIAHCIQHALHGGRVLSIAVAAPSEVPGIVSITERTPTAPGRWAVHDELLQFWRVMAGVVTLNPIHDGRRIDLIGCGVTRSPREGAILLKELWRETGVPFAASDDALSGYLLRTFMENPATQEISLATSDLKVLELYFEGALLGVRNAVLTQHLTGPGFATSALKAHSFPPLPDGPPPEHALSRVSEGAPAYQMAVNLPNSVPGDELAAMSVRPQQQNTYEGPPLQAPVAPLNHVPVGIFTRLSGEVSKLHIKLEEHFKVYDADADGLLSSLELVLLMRGLLPGASRHDVLYFKALLDAEGHPSFTRDQFSLSLAQAVEVEAAVRRGRDEENVMPRLYKYMFENQYVLADVFRELDPQAVGRLEQTELQMLVDMIPGMTVGEKKLILSYLYQTCGEEDGRLSFGDVLALVKNFSLKDSR